MADVAKQWIREKFVLGNHPLYKSRHAEQTTIVPGSQIILTWQGPWGVISNKSVPPGSDELSATDILKKHRYVVNLWDQALQKIKAMQEVMQADQLGASMELCTRSYRQGVIRIHLHACFLSTTGRLPKMELAALRLFKGGPHISHEDEKRKRKRRAAAHSGMYYVIAPKIGSLFTFSTMQPHHDFEVNAEWIWSMVASHKIELSAARQELVGSGKNLARHLQNLDVLEKEREKLAVQTIMQHRAAQIAQTRKASKPMPSVIAWVKDLSIPRDRRKFLVLDGPSRMGKTAYAFSLVDTGVALEVNCAGVSDPPLRAFSRAKHRLILFDEASTDMVLRNRRLFQAPNTPVVVDSSPTNALAYALYLGDTLLVVASNNWEQELSALPEGQRSWLEANMVFVAVKEKLYVEG